MSWLNFFTRRPDGRAAELQPMAAPPPAPMSPGMKKLTALVGTAAVGLVAVTAQWEGKRNDPYQDLVGVWTVCYGDTRSPMRHYTDAECKDMLAERLVQYAQPVLERNPELRGHDPQIIAAASLAYNIGPAAYRRSSVAMHFSSGNWRAACNAFMRWNMAGGRPVAGLTRRREAERAICLRDLP